ncbi:MAG: hypothetical protein EBZ48_14790 [Proteobacteria bacterium]|nr:hypothetical protein [Pseudomonadota bacterium]
MTDGNRPESQGLEGFTPVDGAAIAARILRKYPRAQRERLLTAMQEQVPELATKVQEKMYNIEDIRGLSPKATEELVREVPHQDLVAAVAAAPQELQVKLLDGMSERRRQMVIEDSSYASRTLKPQQLKEAQWRVMQKLDEIRERPEASASSAKRGTWA